MREILSENQALLTYEVTQAGVCILRCQTADAVVQLPDTLDGQPVTALGDYVCAARTPDWAGRSVRQVYLTTRAGQPIPEHNARAIERVCVPQSVRTIGNYAFYNCDKLKSLAFYDGVREIGHGALMNCTAFAYVDMYAPEGARTCLADLLGQTSTQLEVRLHAPTGAARLLFPPYHEELQDLGPAHIFQRRIEGAGYAYRQCVQNDVLPFGQYDGAFERLLRIQDYETACQVALLRLRWPLGLTVSARQMYLDCLRIHARQTACDLVRAGDTAGLTALLSFGVLDAAGASAACDCARELGRTEAAGLLLAALHRQTANTPPRMQKSYDL